ncbi:hypothetical protein Sjap_019968 [Stephania japonica]|uniref:Uncharacterized protein n=1 Tax=Stephania japonica TaxID=461633 RepID=A0AAP0F8T3_9MAGN
MDKAVELRNELASRNPENGASASCSGDPCLPLQWEGCNASLSVINHSSSLASIIFDVWMRNLASLGDVSTLKELLEGVQAMEGARWTLLTAGKIPGGCWYLMLPRQNATGDRCGEGLLCMKDLQSLASQNIEEVENGDV